MLLLAQQNGADPTGLQWQALWQDHGIPLALMGICVVFVALILVSAFITLLPRLMSALDRLHPEDKQQQPAAARKQPAKEDLPEEILVVIAAAVATVISQPHRIVHIRGLTPEDLSWSMEGRFQHHASHRFQPRPRG